MQLPSNLSFVSKQQKRSRKVIFALIFVATMIHSLLVTYVKARCVVREWSSRFGVFPISLLLKGNGKVLFLAG